MTATTTRRISSAITRRTDLAARVCVAACATFLLILGALHLLKRELDPSWRMISEYEIGEYGWLMQAGFVVLATATGALAVAVLPYVVGRAGRVGVVLLLVSAFGMMLGGLAVSDPITASPDELTGHGHLHGLAALVGIPTFPVAALLVSLGMRHAFTGSGPRRTLRLATAVCWVGLVQFVIAMLVFVPANDGDFGPETPVGLPNRLLILTYVLWLATVAITVSRTQARSRP